MVRRREETQRRKGTEEDLLEFLEKKKLKQEEEDREPEKEVLEALGRHFGEFTVPIWLGDKKATKTDVHPHHQRFFFLHSMIEKLKPHLKAWEKGEIEPDGSPGILVSIMDPQCSVWELRLKKWASLQQFALLQGWKQLVQANQLKEGQLVGVWAYRHGPNKKLGFIIQHVSS
ncbi:B3 domain-containing protein At3g25182-like [Aristolochia californica]|uniref:B3 domain-containing protein At3g25182-like n=1 Tax=Aristolochia californica TaxID=171875 RepID=UPI0035D8251D